MQRITGALGLSQLLWREHILHAPLEKNKQIPAGKTKGGWEFTSSCLHLQGYLTKVNSLDPVIADISSATGRYSEVTQQDQGVHSRQHNCKSTQAFPAPIFFSICSHPCRRQKQTSPASAFPSPLTTQDGKNVKLPWMCNF